MVLISQPKLPLLKHSTLNKESEKKINNISKIDGARSLSSLGISANASEAATTLMLDKTFLNRIDGERTPASAMLIH